MLQKRFYKFVNFFCKKHSKNAEIYAKIKLQKKFYRFFLPWKVCPLEYFLAFPKIFYLRFGILVPR